MRIRLLDRGDEARVRMLGRTGRGHGEGGEDERQHKRDSITAQAHDGLDLEPRRRRWPGDGSAVLP